jgi:hypothetical protein
MVNDIFESFELKSVRTDGAGFRRSDLLENPAEKRIDSWLVAKASS